MVGVDVIIEDPKSHPHCIHGPTLLFSRKQNGESKNRSYFACSASRDRKKCSFFVWKDDVERYVNKKISKQILEHQKSINHRKLFLNLNKVKAAACDQRVYCHICSSLNLKDNSETHKHHDLIDSVSDYLLDHPTELLRPLDDSKTEAQYLFSKNSVKTIIGILKQQGYKNVLCIGTPRIFEYLHSDISLGMNSILLDLDSRFHHFFGPLQFCWYNIFNNHFFKEEGRQVFNDFINSTNISNTVLVTDPPFGGRIEPIAYTLSKINDKFKKIHNTANNLPIFWIFPYFMETHLLNSMSDFHMLDYKVDYENHPLFRDGKKGRKYGSPVRIFTNLSPSFITLPADEGYKHCNICDRWVSEENEHCKKCGSCTSKDGRTYVHCKSCEKCVKPSWSHCSACNKCVVKDHSCGDLAFEKTCFHCKEMGHKKSNCPKVDHEELAKKRKMGLKTERQKKKSKNY